MQKAEYTQVPRQGRCCNNLPISCFALDGQKNSGCVKNSHSNSSLSIKTHLFEKSFPGFSRRTLSNLCLVDLEAVFMTGRFKNPDRLSD